MLCSFTAWDRSVTMLWDCARPGCQTVKLSIMQLSPLNRGQEITSLLQRQIMRINNQEFRGPAVIVAGEMTAVCAATIAQIAV